MPSPSPFRAWDDAPAILLSCPGPLRPHHRAMLPVAQLALPQCLLGYEAQLSAFAAAFPALQPRLLFTPLPEMFSTAESLAPLAALVPGASASRPVHLRFGSARVGRVLKPARNGAVLAEVPVSGPVTTSAHPLASGRVLPAAVRRAFVYSAGVAPFSTTTGEVLPTSLLPAACINADVQHARRAPRPPDPQHPGLDLVSFAEFNSAHWAAGPVRARSAHLREVMRESQLTFTPFVLLPWNLDDPGSIVPELLVRLAELQDAARPLLRLLVLPFNYPGQIGLIRRLIARVRNAAPDPARVLPQSFIARLTRLESLPLLLRLAAIAWVDGNDPEHSWTLRRLAACGIATILLDAAAGAPPDTRRVAADETLWIAAETRWGLLNFASRMPSRRALPALLAETAACREAYAAAPPDAARRSARRPAPAP